MFKWLRKNGSKKLGKDVVNHQEVCYNIYINKKGENKMENLKAAIAGVKGRKFKVANDKVNQLERNALKAEMLKALVADLVDAGVQVSLVDKGLAFVVANDQLGSLAFGADVVVKNLDYDFNGAVLEYAEKQAEKLAKAQKAKAKA